MYLRISLVLSLATSLLIGYSQCDENKTSPLSTSEPSSPAPSGGGPSSAARTSASRDNFWPSTDELYIDDEIEGSGGGHREVKDDLESSGSGFGPRGSSEDDEDTEDSGSGSGGEFIPGKKNDKASVVSTVTNTKTQITHSQPPSGKDNSAGANQPGADITVDPSDNDEDPDEGGGLAGNEIDPSSHDPSVSIMNTKPHDRPASFFAQPGILAAVIGGAVVGLLCAILVVMFIVYRMRKKDEGSYALDEPKRSPTVNSYTKSTNREFYA